MEIKRVYIFIQARKSSLVVYVDDILSKHIEIKNLGNVKNFCGLEMRKEKNIFQTSQRGDTY